MGRTGRFIEQLGAAVQAADEIGGRPAAVCGQLLRVVLGATGLPAGGLLVFDPVTLRLELMASRLSERSRDSLVGLGQAPEEHLEIYRAIRERTPLLLHAGGLDPLLQGLTAHEDLCDAVLFLPLAAYRNPTGLLVLLGDHDALTSVAMGEVSANLSLLGCLLPRHVSGEPVSLLVDVEPVTTVSATALGGTVVLLDDAVTLDGMTVAGHKIMVEVPNTDIARRLTDSEPSAVVVNLAAAEAFDTLLAMRAAGATRPVLGCVSVSALGQSLPLGRVDVVPTLGDLDEVRNAIQGVAPAAKRVLAVGSDSTSMLALRQALARDGLTVSIAWNADDGVRLLAAERPNVLLVDLGLPGDEGYGMVVAASKGDPHPGLVLVPGFGAPADGFAALFERDPRLLEAAPPLHELLWQLLDGVGQNPRESPAAPLL
jgi:ActR/RegA family two-component response regulator